MRYQLGFVTLSVACFLCHCSRPAPTVHAEGTNPERHANPTDLVLVGDSWVLTTNSGDDSVALVDFRAGQVLSRVAVGKKPEHIALSPDRKIAVVSNLWSHSLTVLQLGDKKLTKLRDIPVGAFPRGLVFDPDGRHVWVAISGDSEVAKVDPQSGKVAHRFAAEREPRHLALSADRLFLIAGCSKSAEVRWWNLKTLEPAGFRVVHDAFNLRGLATQGEFVVMAHSIHRDFPITQDNLAAGWVVDSRLTRVSLSPKEGAYYWQIALDRRGEAVGDTHGVAFNPPGHTLAVTAGGTQELLLFQNQHIPWSPGAPGDHIDFSLEDGIKLRRISLGGRPLGLAFSGDDTVLVANALLDAVQVIDAKAGKVVRTVSLGGPKTPSLARRGEALFYDAQRSHAGWFSCNTCHVDGHTNGQRFDTLNDHNFGSPKLTPSLRNSTRTAPYTWIGWQKDLGHAIKKSFTDTMYGPDPTDDEVAAVTAFLETLQAPPHPRPQLSEAAQRGKALFESKAACFKCHRGDYFTSPGVHDVKIGYDTDLNKLWNPPSLIGAFDRGPYLHDGRARTLEELFGRHHTSEMVGGEKLSDGELRDLIEYVRGL